MTARVENFVYRPQCVIESVTLLPLSRLGNRAAECTVSFVESEISGIIRYGSVRVRTRANSSWVEVLQEARHSGRSVAVSYTEGKAFNYFVNIN
jgi:hypothetical protein